MENNEIYITDKNDKISNAHNYSEDHWNKSEKGNINLDDQDQIKPFEFGLHSISKLKPKDILQIKNSEEIIANRNPNVANFLNNLAYEAFDNNEYFPMRKEESKLVKIYQAVIQYINYTNEHLERKKNILEDLCDQQTLYSNKADEILAKQKEKIKLLEARHSDLDDSLLHMEFLIKKLGLKEKFKHLNLKAKIYRKNRYEENVFSERQSQLDDLSSSVKSYSDNNLGSKAKKRINKEYLDNKRKTRNEVISEKIDEKSEDCTITIGKNTNDKDKNDLSEGEVSHFSDEE